MLLLLEIPQKEKSFCFFWTAKHLLVVNITNMVTVMFRRINCYYYIEELLRRALTSHYKHDHHLGKILNTSKDVWLNLHAKVKGTATAMQLIEWLITVQRKTCDHWILGKKTMAELFFNLNIILLCKYPSNGSNHSAVHYWPCQGHWQWDTTTNYNHIHDLSDDDHHRPQSFCSANSVLKRVQ